MSGRCRFGAYLAILHCCSACWELTKWQRKPGSRSYIHTHSWLLKVHMCCVYCVCVGAAGVPTPIQEEVLATMQDLLPRMQLAGAHISDQLPLM